MKVKFLLFALLMLLPWCAKAQEQEKTFKVYFSDLPEGLDVSDFGMTMLVKDEYGERECHMYYSSGDDYLFTSSNYYYELNDASSVRLVMHSRDLISNDTIDWQLDTQVSEHSKTISLKDYRKVYFDIEEGWNFHTKISENEYQLSGFSVGYELKIGGSVYSPVGGSTGTVVDSPEKQDYYVYAKPGEYLWNGDITRISDNTKVAVSEGRFTVPEGSGNASIDIDLENNTVATFNVSSVDSNISDFRIIITHGYEDGVELILDQAVSNGTLSVLLPNSKTYEWQCTASGTDAYFVPLSGEVEVHDGSVDIDVDFSNYVKCTINVAGLESFDSYSGNINLNVFSSYIEGDAPVVIYMPAGLCEGTVDLWAYDNEENYTILPYYINMNIDQDKVITIDYSKYHRVSFMCEDTYIGSNLINEKGDYLINGSKMLLPDGDYIAMGYYDDGIKLTKEFTVSGNDMTVVYDYNAEDYAPLYAEVKNAALIPDVLNAYSFDINLYKDGEEAGSLYFYLNSELEKTKKFEKGVYTYEAHISGDGPYSIYIPIRGTIDLTENASISFDMADFCYVPLEISNDTQTPIDFLYYAIDNELESLDYLEIENAYIVALPGTYDMTFYSPRHEKLEKSVVLDKQTEKVELNLKSADLYPLMIYVYGDDATTININVEGVGSYQIIDDEYVGDLFPFLAVKSGTYKLTITAEGYETITQMVEVSEDAYSRYDEGVVYEFELKKEGSSVEDVKDAEEPVVTVERGRINVVAQQNADIKVYSMNGYCVAAAQGTELATETLASGLYIVKTVSAYGTATKKVLVGK